MDYKKAYEDAEREARNVVALIEGKKGLAGSMAFEVGYVEELLKKIFPNLPEGEDERIRKDIIAFIKAVACKTAISEEREGKWITYLEKQKEQKPVETQDYSDLTDFERVIHRGFLAAGVENVPVTIIKETAKESLDVVINREAKGLLLNGFISFEEYLKIADVPYADKILQERKARHAEKVKPTEWSEEDEDMLNSCISSIEEAKENRYAYKETDGDTSYDHEIEWLKSIRPSWKPSEQEKGALRTAIHILTVERNFPKAAVAQLQNILNAFEGDKSRKDWKPSEDEERLINTSISFLKDFADKGYENAVECIDWLKSKLNGNSGK